MLGLLIAGLGRPGAADACSRSSSPTPRRSRGPMSKGRVHERAVLAAALVESLLQTIGQQVPQYQRSYGGRVVTARELDANRQQDTYLALLDRAGGCWRAPGVHSPGRVATSPSRRRWHWSAQVTLTGSGMSALRTGRGTSTSPCRSRRATARGSCSPGYRPSSLAPLLAGELRKIPGVKGAHNYLIDGRRHGARVRQPSHARPAIASPTQPRCKRSEPHIGRPRAAGTTTRCPGQLDMADWCSPHPTARCSPACPGCTNGCRG